MKMAKGKYHIHVFLRDHSVEVSCEHGEYVSSPVSNAWLWVLGAVARPEEHIIEITDGREHRQPHQYDMTTHIKEERP